MRALFHAFAAFFACMLACGAARADTPITLFKSFAGNLNFVGTQKTMRTKSNALGPCAVTPVATDVSASLTGIPASATIVSAHLYWAGSHKVIDTAVMFDGAQVTADAARRYSSATVGAGFDYFGAAADVTAQVTSKRNGTYKFSGLTIGSGAPYCGDEAVLGGFALLVVYSDAGEPFRVLNLYEGFQFIRYNGVSLTLRNFRIPTPLATATGKIGHLTWEGDKTIGADGEGLFFNSVELNDSLNLKGNQFNSASNINNDASSYGIDFDAYTVGANALTAGQTSATSRYQSSQDLVLLNAEIIAVPNVPAADLTIAMTRNTALTLSQNATYTLTVGNGGPKPETGPVVVTTTLPAGLSHVSAAGTGWTCGAAAKVVTCSRAGSIAVGAIVPAITLIVRVDASGTLKNSAQVAGQLFDNVTANNVATDTAETTAPAVYVFTDSACVAGKAFGNGAQPCKQLSGLPVIAGMATPIFVTALTGGVPTELSGAADTTLEMSFALSCINPASHAGMAARYSGVTLPLCASSGDVPTAWKDKVGMVFKQGAPSVAVNASFSYADVGKVQLFMKDAEGRVVGAVPFVVKPYKLAIVAVTRSTPDRFPNPQTQTATGFGFMKAGEAFTVTAAAYASGSVDPAPNFGSEGAILTVSAQRGGDGHVQDAMLDLPELDGEFTSVVGGVFTGAEFSFGEVGVLSLTPKLANNDYLGAGLPTSISSTTVGRFYPAYFDTVTSANMTCLPHMGCPETGSGATYSKQAFSVTVSAMNASGVALRNYRDALARDITLTAHDLAGGAALNPSAGVLSANVIAQVDVARPAEPIYTLPKPFINTAPRELDWTVPTPIFLRASANENIDGGTVVVTSKRGGASIEGGVTVVNGRLALDNPHGPESLKMPVRAEAQYWSTAKRWETSATDNLSPVQSGGISFAKCLKALGPPCKAALLGVTTDTELLLVNGVTTFWLKAPGAGNHGSAEFQMTNPAWLPSTIGRAVFGVYKSPFIYRRELY